MEYLECDKCHQQYELLDGENPEDFNSQCGCGGTLRIPFDEKKYNNALPFDFRKDGLHNPLLKSIIKIVGTVVIVLGTLFWLLAFWPIGLLCILLLMAWIKIIT